MKHALSALAVVLTLGTGVAEAAQAAADGGRSVMPAQRRLQALKTADEVLVVRTPTWKEIVTDLPDPFFRANFVPAVSAVEATPELPAEKPAQSGIDILNALAPQIQPTGSLVLGDNRVLLVGGRPYKVGETIKITHGGLVYEIVFSAIERNSYVLQLGEHELRREFK